MAPGRNDNDSVSSLLSLNVVKDKKLKKNDIVSGIYSETVVPSRKNNFFNQRMIYFVNRLEVNHEKYQ